MITSRNVAASLSRRGALGRLGVAVVTSTGLTNAGVRSAVAQATPGAGASEAVARQALAAVNEAMASGEMSVLDAVFAPDVAGHPPHRSLVTGETFSHDLAGLKAGLADVRLFFPDAAITIDDLITSGETVAARVTFRGTPDDAVLGVGEDARQPLEIGGIMYGRIADGRVAEFWVYFDLSAYFALIGVLPAGMVATPEIEAEHGHEAEPILESPHPGAEQIAVTLTEFSVTPARATLQVGQPYTFVVTNEGAVPHEFVIERAGAVHDPLEDDDRHAMTQPIPPGTSESLTWTFEDTGAYQLACHQPGHYEAGQVFVIDVTE